MVLLGKISLFFGWVLNLKNGLCRTSFHDLIRLKCHHVDIISVFFINSLKTLYPFSVQIPLKW